MTTLYRGMDRETLDREYNARETVPDFLVFMQRYAVMSAEARLSLPCHLNVAYGSTEAEAMDIFPAGDHAPAFVFIHGGYWRLLSKDNSAFMAPALREAGVATVALDYALAPAVTLDEIVRQVRSSIAWIWANGREFGIDPDRIFVGGSSAGGHLAGMTVAEGWHEAFGVPADIVKGAIPVSGLFDLEPIRLCHVNEWLSLDRDAARRLSPDRHIPANGVPLVVAWGGEETAEFARQSRDYAAAWRAGGGDAVDFEVAGRNHFDVVLDLADPDSRLFRETLALIEGR